MQVVAKIGAALFALSIRFLRAAEKLLEDSAGPAAGGAEDFAKNIEGIVKAAAARARPGALKGLVSVAIVRRALFGIHEDIVGLADLLKLILGGRVAGVFVRVKLDRELAVGALDLVARGGAGDFEYFVIVALGGHRI